MPNSSDGNPCSGNELSTNSHSFTTEHSAARMFYQRMTERNDDFSRDRELVPAPMIDMNFETFYANESIIGYTYNVTLTGHAASKQDRLHNGATPSIGYVVGSIARIQSLFNNVGNGGKLVIKKPYEDAPMMVFKGGRIKSINFTPTSNNWVQYSDYTISLEFNDVELYGCNYNFIKGCDNVLFQDLSDLDGDINYPVGCISGVPCPAECADYFPCPSGCNEGSPCPSGCGEGSPCPSGCGEGSGMLPCPSGCEDYFPCPSGCEDYFPCPSGCGGEEPCCSGCVELADGQSICPSGGQPTEPESKPTLQDELVDFKKYRIKAFNDNWNINLADEIYDFTRVDDAIDLSNKRYTVEYTVSATGQHYWDENEKLFPAWKQAKAFCQDKLVKQINGFYNNMALHYTGPENQICNSEEGLQDIHRQTSPTIHNTIGAMSVFNETITVNPSESDGTCSITYNAIVKAGKESCVTSLEAIHNINISFQGQNECGKTKGAKSVTLSGSIEGLLKGNNQGSIIWPNSEGFSIPDSPDQPVLICHRDTNKHKWKNAKVLLDRFIDNRGAIVCNELCSIIMAGVASESGDECKNTCTNSCTHPASFNITHNYNAGTIDYNVEFNYDGNNRESICNITVSTEEPVPLTAEFTIPGRGMYYQPLGGCTPRKWSINAEGRIAGYDNISCSDLTQYLTVCGAMPVGCTGLIPPDGYLLTSKQQTFNPIDGSFSYNASYVCTICPGPGGNCS